mgnify:CR=1 FL=1
MKRKFLASMLALALCVSTVLTGCGGGSSNESTTTESTTTNDTATEDTSSETTTDEVSYKKELNVAITANPPSLDVHSVNSNIVAGIGTHIYEPLFALNGNYEVTPVLAEGYEVDETGLVYTIKLRQGVKFHNGQEMKADDVVASMTRWLELSSKANTLIGGTVFEKVDDYTITMTVNQAAADIMLVLAGPIQFAAIYPKSVVDAATPEGIPEYIGTGPYKLGEWKQDQYVQLVANPDYQVTTEEPSGFTGIKTAATETIYFRIVTDNATRIAGVQTGEYDIAESIPLEQYKDVSADANLTVPTKTAGTLNLFFNTTKGALANETMRQAVLAALNCEDIMLAAYGDPDLYTLNPGWCNPKDAQWGSDAGKEYYSQNNVEKAKQLLTEAGYPDGFDLEVTVPSNYAFHMQTAEVAVEQLKAVGINAKINAVEWNTWLTDCYQGRQYESTICGITSDITPGYLLNRFVSTSSKNFINYSSQAYDEAYAKVEAAATLEERAVYYKELQQILCEDAASAFIQVAPLTIAMNKELGGYKFYPVYVQDMSTIYWMSE